MEWYLYVAVVVAGFAAGFINTLAGSGSLITLPLLIFCGLPATVANGTNRVAILLQTAVAVRSFRRQKALRFKRGLILATPAAIGAIIGAQIAADLDEELLRRIIGVLMVIMLAVVIIRPRRWLQGREWADGERTSLGQLITFFGIGVYGGFIQAGVGIFLLAGLVLSAGFDLVRANGVKNLIVLVFTIFALAVFIFNDQVDWLVGVVLGVGNMLGAWVAARMAIKRGATFVRWLLIGVLVVSAVVLLGAVRI
jgi:uncharacterized membrane protein YfcA